ncbi:hypothetical protein L6452_36946 [Arctium lappa]|uniref:Uncharacterized protein n=1 Tax=Arctium lappa TaxID=4217 RepID=A0ACB8Y1P8_ARCLA|nr:hypothetical protein L6452_36946 [Arctium lappa]
MIMASEKVKIAEAADFSHEDPLSGGTLMSVGLPIKWDEALQPREDSIMNNAVVNVFVINTPCLSPALPVTRHPPRLLQLCCFLHALPFFIDSSNSKKP